MGPPLSRLGGGPGQRAAEADDQPDRPVAAHDAFGADDARDGSGLGNPAGSQADDDEGADSEDDGYQGPSRRFSAIQAP